MENKDFSTMTAVQQESLVKQIGQTLKSNSMGGININIVTEQVCDLVKKTVEKSMKLVIKQELPQSLADSCYKFKQEVKQHTDGVKGISINVGCATGVAGSDYETIMNVMPLKGEEAVEIEHKEGEVLLIDFWATSCLPC
jgi:thiol-disulfide isomerase/thioredoxin